MTSLERKLIGKIPNWGEVKAKYGLHKKASLTDVPAAVLARYLSADDLAALVMTKYFGNHYEALKRTDPNLFNLVNHYQWDITLSSMAGTRVCGKSHEGRCPFPFEARLEFVKETRPDLQWVEDTSTH